MLNPFARLFWESHELDQHQICHLWVLPIKTKCQYSITSPNIVALTNVLHQAIFVVKGQRAYNHRETKPKFCINIALNKCTKAFCIGRVTYRAVTCGLPENRRAHIFLNSRSVCGRPIKLGGCKCCVPIFCCWSEEPTLQLVQTSRLYTWCVDKMVPVAWDVWIV